ncbi:B12-binding domain-containing radical SAM protein [Flavobacterium sp. J49]|uniref:B12-binding domain-containing radical SAM protein n=1 Tax=Flavobacterium sp. J49 TaxID=2718534 RepID=UPI0015939F5C|nr:radical SAM protein [Flavobacterium sp. J49]MBF6641193.1 B12-binding domain-containing radical SAM protein [Flavobacterium sp. J49]NIC02440.1 B12-binding domain-containing radical SAM protein [Flavobacterium sp. J49]
MSIVFTHAYYLSDDPKEQKIMKPYPPLGLLYVSAYLKSKKIDNDVFDTTFSSQSAQLDFILEKQPKVICIYTNLMTKIEVIKLIKILKSDTYHFPKIVLGGPDVTYNVANYLKAGADFLVIGEGEETTFELYNAIMTNGNFNKVNGIAFLENNQIIQTTARTKFKELDELPLPNREAINMQNYLDTWKTNHGKSSMTISTQRGCPYTCKWCSTAVYGQSYRRRPANQVAEEMKMLKEKYNPDALWFVDDVFTVSHKWLIAFREEVLKQDAVIPFECITRAERLNDEILQLLKEVGCFRIWIGAESGSQTIIDAMDRRVDVNQVKKVIQDTNAMGIETGTFIMLGYPGETEKDITETIQYLKEANPTLYTITIAYPIKGTSLYNDIEHKITTQPDWETSTDREIDFERTYSRKYYQYAVSKVVNEVEFHKVTSKTSLKALKLKTKSILASGLMKWNK